MIRLDLSRVPPGLFLGTSSFSSSDWIGSFYPPGLAPADFLRHYAGILRTVEIDATWHAVPSRRTVAAWAARVPRGFVFSVKAPKTITHERYLTDCAEEWRDFLEVTEPFGEKLGPIVFQFQYVSHQKDAREYATGEDFLSRLKRFLPLLPRQGRYVVEVRNQNWLKPPLLDTLRERNVALALVSYTTMPTAAELLEQIDPVTADFSYIRFLGDHAAMDHRVARARELGLKTRDWDELVVDRTADTRGWLAPISEILRRVPEVFVYFNNHYAGFAPGSLELFLRLWDEEMAASPDRS
jgi:uncharacterized protein YecE (DUF72 family)